MLLSILIPTYNRSRELIKNITQLIQYISILQRWNEIEIVCADNNSDDQCRENLRKFFADNKSKIVTYFHSKNIGFEKNLLFLLKNCSGKYVMLLGDDDYISFDYLKLVLEYLNTQKISAIFPNCYSVNENGIRISDTRDAICGDRILQQVEDIKYVVKAHQLSGLVFEKSGVYESYINSVKSNLYPQMYFMGFNLLRGNGVHITRFPVINTVIEKKNFDYQFDHLFGEIAKSVEAIDLEYHKKIEFLNYVISYNFERIFNRYTILHPYKLINKVIFKYQVSPLFKKLIIIGLLKSYSIFIKQFLKKVFQ